MFFSKACEYALQAVIFLGAQPGGSPVLQRDIARALHIPSPFLGKILQILSAQGLMGSRKGRNGGFFLIRPASQLTPSDVIEAVDGQGLFEECIIGFPGCSDANACPFHEEWTLIKERLLGLIRETSIEELSRNIDLKLAFLEDLRDNNEGIDSPQPERPSAGKLHKSQEVRRTDSPT